MTALAAPKPRGRRNAAALRGDSAGDSAAVEMSRGAYHRIEDLRPVRGAQSFADVFGQCDHGRAELAVGEQLKRHPELPRDAAQEVDPGITDLGVFETGDRAPGNTHPLRELELPSSATKLAEDREID